VADNIFLAITDAEKLSATDEEKTPIHVPFYSQAGAVCLLEKF
jgi:hypothetical protein